MNGCIQLFFRTIQLNRHKGKPVEKQYPSSGHRGNWTSEVLSFWTLKCLCLSQAWGRLTKTHLLPGIWHLVRIWNWQKVLIQPQKPIPDPGLWFVYPLHTFYLIWIYCSCLTCMPPSPPLIISFPCFIGPSCVVQLFTGGSRSLHAACTRKDTCNIQRGQSKGHAKI